MMRVILLAVVAVCSTAFTTTTRRPSFSSVLYSSSYRAGTEGYSVTRQPVSRANWDPTLDPDYKVSTLFGNETTSSTDQDWWQQKSSSSSSKKAKKDETVIELAESDDQLDLFQRSLDTLDYPRVLQALLKECTTAPSKQLTRLAVKSSSNATITRRKKKLQEHEIIAYQPLTADTVQGARDRYTAVEEMTRLIQGPLLGTYRNRLGYQQDLSSPPYPGHSYNIAELLEQVDKENKVLESEELWEVVSMMDSMENVQLWKRAVQKVDDYDFTQLIKIADAINVNSTLQELLHNAFEKDGRLSGTTFPTLGNLRGKVRALKADIISKLEGFLALPSIKSKLALESGGAAYSEVNGRLVIPIDSKHTTSGSSAIGMIHDTSRSGKTAYVEPQIILGPTNDLKQVQGELRAEEARVWRLLTEQIWNNRFDLETSAMAIGQLDLVVARIMLGRQLAGIVPEVQDEGVIALRNAKHPVLLLRNIDNVVGSDIDLGANGNQGLVLTGPNSGGKTVILKLLGLVALMARSGLPIPADAERTNGITNGSTNGESMIKPRVDFFNPVLADIGDIQSVGGDLSTFSGHMLVCREVLANSGRNALVLMDELGSGTDPAQGVAIAQALLEALMETGSRVAITTHYMQLKQLAASDERFAVAGMQFVGGRPTYKLLPGTVGESFALAVAERLQLPKSVITRATELLDSETRQMGDLIRDLEDQKALADQQLMELEERKKQIAKLEFEMKEQRIKLDKKLLNARRDEAKKFAKQLEEKEQVLEDVLEKLKSDPSRRVVAKSWNDIKFVKRDALNEAENIPSVVAKKKEQEQALDEASADLIPIAEMRDKPDLSGDNVELVVCKKGPLFGRKGVVTKTLGSNRVELQVSNMNVAFKLSEVALPVENFVYSTGNKSSTDKPKSVAKAAERAIAEEQKTVAGSQKPSTKVEKPTSSVAIRTQSNTADVRGCNLEQAKEMIQSKFSTCAMSGWSTVYILHGHGSGGILRNKVRGWLRSQTNGVVQKYGPADVSDGGDAFTQVQLKS